MTTTEATALVHTPGPPRVSGAAILYNLYDIGYELDLEKALDLLAGHGPQRVRPMRGEGQALQIPNPPVTVLLGSENVAVGDWRQDVEMSARLFDFGVVSLRLRVDTPGELSWEEFLRFGGAVDAGTGLRELFDHHVRLLVERISPAITRPALAPVREDYIVYRVNALRGADGTPLTTDALRDEDVAPLLLNESRPLSPDALRELLPRRFSYYADDLAILTWDNALVVEPQPYDTDVQYILEFANAQLLELRYFDALLDDELPRMYDRVEAARARPGILLGRRFAPLLADLQTLVADNTELVERVENALKVTDDVYLSRIYAAALEIFRGRAWRAGIDRKLDIIRDTYTMLNAESQAARAQVLELAIVLLFVFDIVVAFVVK